MKQSISLLTVLAALVLAAGLIETQPLISLGLVGIMAAAAYIGKLDKRRVTYEDIERRCRNGKN